jgi:hypothetical protein
MPETRFLLNLGLATIRGRRGTRSRGAAAGVPGNNERALDGSAGRGAFNIAALIPDRMFGWRAHSCHARFSPSGVILGSYFSSVACRTVRAAAWLVSSFFCPALCAVRRCSAKALLKEGLESAGNASGKLNTVSRHPVRPSARKSGFSSRS